MEKIELLKIMREGLKKLSKVEVKMGDFRYIRMFEEFRMMRGNGLKYQETIRILSEDYDVSRATVERIIKRLSGNC